MNVLFLTTVLPHGHYFESEVGATRHEQRPRHGRQDAEQLGSVSRYNCMLTAIKEARAISGDPMPRTHPAHFGEVNLVVRSRMRPLLRWSKRARKSPLLPSEGSLLDRSRRDLVPISRPALLVTCRADAFCPARDPLAAGPFLR
jgi:hypothetical protein